MSVKYLIKISAVSQNMTKENPTKRPKVPPNSATSEVRGQTRTSFFRIREDFENSSENIVILSFAPTGVYGRENSVYRQGGRQPVNLMMLSMSKRLKIYFYHISWGRIKKNGIFHTSLFQQRFRPFMQKLKKKKNQKFGKLSTHFFFTPQIIHRLI